MPEPFSPEQYIEVAEHLAAVPTNEPRLRAAVSRAYYAIFLMIRAKARIIGKDSVHERAKVATANKSSAQGGTFQTLRDLRVHADYVLRPGDQGYDSAYDDWQDNWENAKWCIESLLPFIKTWA